MICLQWNILRGGFKKRYIEVDCRLKQLEPASQWGSAADSCMRELKQASARKMPKKKSPKVLWDDCLELESAVRSHIVNGSFELNGEVPQTHMTGETADLSEFPEFESYEWVMFRDNKVPYPNGRLTLGRYFGPSTNIWPAMTAKILKENGHIVSRTTVHHLTDELLDSTTHKASRIEFDKATEAIMGDIVVPADFPINAAYDLNEFQEMDQFSIPIHELYEDEQQAAVPL